LQQRIGRYLDPADYAPFGCACPEERLRHNPPCYEARSRREDFRTRSIHAAQPVCLRYRENSIQIRPWRPRVAEMTDHQPLLSVRGFNPRLAGRRYPQRAWNSRLQRCQMAEQLSARNARISAVSPRISRWSAQRLPMHCAFTRREIVRTVRKPQSTVSVVLKPRF
jgi:hypothetical protein